MISEINLTDSLFLEEIQSCNLPPSQFTHENMLRLSWILINKYGLEMAIKKNHEIKENYFKNALNNDKFNITLSKAYVEILHHFMNQTSSEDFNQLLREFPRLKFNFKNLVKTHYGYNILKEHRKEEPIVKRPILFTF